MFEEIRNGFDAALGLGLNPNDLTALQMGLRAVIVYIIGIELVIFGKKRFLGQSTAFDALLGFMLGSVLSRAINGEAPFFETLFGALALTSIHTLFGYIAVRSHRFGRLIKGTARPLVEHGRMLRENMKLSHISEHDLREAVRLNGKVHEIEEVEYACLERNGSISVIPCVKEPRVVEVAVREGVQTVRVVIE